MTRGRTAPVEVWSSSPLTFLHQADNEAVFVWTVYDPTHIEVHDDTAGHSAKASYLLRSPCANLLLLLLIEQGSQGPQLTKVTRPNGMTVSSKPVSCKAKHMRFVDAAGCTGSVVQWQCSPGANRQGRPQ